MAAFTPVRNTNFYVCTFVDMRQRPRRKYKDIQFACIETSEHTLETGNARNFTSTRSNPQVYRLAEFDATSA